MNSADRKYILKSDQASSETEHTHGHNSCKPPSPSAEVELDFTFKWQKQLCDQTMKEEKTWSKFVEGSLQNG